MTGSISKKTSYLVHGSILEDGRPPSESSKYKKAKELGTKILSESEFDDFLEKSKIAVITLSDPHKEAKRRLADGIMISIPAAADTKSGSGQASASVKKPLKSDDNTLWTTKYAPEHVNQIIGNQSAIKEIITWLQDW